MKLNNHYSDEELEEKSEEIEENFENLEEGSEKQGRLNLGKIIGFLGILKLQGLKVSEKALDYFFIVLEFTIRITKKVFGFLCDKIAFKSRVKSLWTKEADVYKMYLVYRKVVSEQANDYFNRFKRAKNEEEQKKWEEKANNFSTQNTSLPKIPFGYKVEFAFKSSFHDAKYPIINVTLCIMIFFSIMLDMNGLTAPIFLNLKFLVLTYSVFLNIVYFNNIRKVNDLVENNNQYYNDIWDFTIKGYNKIIDEINSRINKGKLKGKDEADKQLQPVKQQSAVPQSSTVQQQPKQEEVYNNPYADTWRTIFDELFPKNVKDKFKVPEYKKFETTEVHIFNIPTLTVDKLTDKSEEIENYMGMNIYKIHMRYGSVGRIGVEFETVELPVLIPYNEVPQPKKKDEIILGKGIKDWVTWNLNVSPHAYVVCPTRGGKSNTMNFLICEVLKQGWMPYFVDFKIVEFKVYESKGYTVISGREDYARFVDELYGELLYRLKVLAEKGFKNINSLNKKYPNSLKRMVVFFDEYADVNSFKDDFTVNINTKIGQLLAKSGAVGIHLFFSTQRPDAKVFGEGAFRDNVTCRIIGLMNSESGERMARGVDSLSKEDKMLINKIPKDDRKRGMFVVQGTGSIDENEIIRVPFMEDEEFQGMVLNEWEDNPYADYKLHYSEEDFEDEGDEVLNKMYGKGKEDVVEAEYEVVEDDEVVQDDDFDLEEYLL